jgi:very-short-patch-repair endonuclease
MSRFAARPGTEDVAMSIASTFHRHGPFLRRRDLLRLGHGDRAIREALRAHVIFRVRHGWYATPSGKTDVAIRAIRVGGRLTGRSALASYGLRVPRPARVQVAVPRNACRLRKPTDKGERLGADDGIDIEWVDPARLTTDPTVWRATVDDALLSVLKSDDRDIAVACCDLVMRYEKWSWARLDAVFARAPARVQGWRALVVADSDAHGETFVRLWCADVGIRFVPQPRITGVGRLDGRISPHVYIEIDGAQHAEDWGDEETDVPSSFEPDHARDAAMTIRGDTVLRFTYRQILADWDTCLAAMERAIADDVALTRYRTRHPFVRRGFTKRRRSSRNGSGIAQTRRVGARSPSN